MKVMLLILTLLAIAGCEVSESNAQSASHSVDSYTVFRNNSNAVVDGCEYFFSNENGTLSHKGNCKNCREFYKQLFKGQQ